MGTDGFDDRRRGRTTRGLASSFITSFLPANICLDGGAIAIRGFLVFFLPIFISFLFTLPPCPVRHCNGVVFSLAFS